MEQHRVWHRIHAGVNAVKSLSSLTKPPNDPNQNTDPGSRGTAEERQRRCRGIGFYPYRARGLAGPPCSLRSQVPPEGGTELVPGGNQVQSRGFRSKGGLAKAATVRRGVEQRIDVQEGPHSSSQVAAVSIRPCSFVDKERTTAVLRRQSQGPLGSVGDRRRHARDDPRGESRSPGAPGATALPSTR